MPLPDTCVDSLDGKCSIVTRNPAYRGSGMMQQRSQRVLMTEIDSLKMSEASNQAHGELVTDTNAPPRPAAGSGVSRQSQHPNRTVPSHPN